MRQVFHDNRWWIPLSNDAQHLCYVWITDATQLLHGIVKRSSAQTTAAAVPVKWRSKTSMIEQQQYNVVQ